MREVYVAYGEGITKVMQVYFDGPIQGFFWHP